mgnify:CR=1 FL=1
MSEKVKKYLKCESCALKVDKLKWIPTEEQWRCYGCIHFGTNRLKEKLVEVEITTDPTANQDDDDWAAWLDGLDEAWAQCIQDWEGAEDIRMAFLSGHPLD